MQKLSVITINFNNREGLRRTLESVAAQTTRDFEYIVIDGGSTDGSVEVIKEFESIITYWISEPDRGIYHAMNKGVANAHGEYCNFLNSGDIYHSSEVVHNFNSSNVQADVLTGIQYQINSDQKSKLIRVLPPKEITLELMFCRGLLHQSCMIRTVLLKNNPYDENLKIVSDWKFFVQELLLNGKSFQPLDFEIVDYDASGISAMRADLLKQERAEVLNTLIPERVLDGIYGLINGRTFLEKVVRSAQPNGMTEKVLTFHARLLYSIIHTYIKSRSIISTIVSKIHLLCKK